MTTLPMALNPACIKTLSAVEALPDHSHQHEFNGVRELRDIFGTATFSKPARFSIRGTPVSVVANVTWYDARDAHPTRSEYRLYFQGNEVMAQAKEGDNILIGIDGSGALHVILIRQGASDFRPNVSTWEAA